MSGAGRSAVDGTRRARSGRSPARRLAVLAPLAVLAFVLLVDPVRAFEARLTGVLLGPRARLSNSPGTLIISGTDTVRPFAVEMSRSCSVMSIALGALVIAGSFLRAGPVRRAVAVGAAIAVALALNLGRAIGIILVGRDRGPGDMVAVHDWIGTVITVTTASLSLAVLLIVGTDRRHAAIAPPGDERRPPM